MMKSAKINKLIKLHGSTTPITSPLMLNAGNLTLEYEKGNIRYITGNGHEIIRMIYAAVRDDKWITVEPAITGEEITVSEDNFSIIWHAHYRLNEIDFESGYWLSGGPGNVIRFAMKGRANSTFMKNRIGFCVLHPLETCRGTSCVITHSDGRITSGRFPEKISPHQPFTDIAAMKWNIGNDLQADLKFSGDVFETEDQRNWTDSSYKTYSTPLSIPYPVVVNKGEEFYQEVELSVSGNLKKPAVKGAGLGGVLKPGKNEVLIKAFPETGLSVSSRKSPMSRQEASLIRKIGFSFLRGELHLFATYLPEQYRRIKKESEDTSLPVQLCLFFDDSDFNDRFAGFIKLNRENPFVIHSFILFSSKEKVTPAQLFETISPVLKKEFDGKPVGAGTNCNFAQLNRDHVGAVKADLVSYAVHPREHASDDVTLLENIVAQKDTVATAIEFSSGKPVYVSPVTLQRRFNANVSTYEIPVTVQNKFPAQVDVRQMSLFSAVWTVGSLKYIIESGVTGVSYYETVGERGLFMGNKTTRWPDEFHATKGMFFPVYHVFKFLLQEKAVGIIGMESTIPGKIDGIAIMYEHFGHLVISNFTGYKQSIQIRDFSELKAIFRLNTNTFIQATARPDYSEGPGSVLKNKVIEMLPYETIGLTFKTRE